ncbi:MAG: EamA family transporter RarD [Actinomycetales bacterium]
MTEAAATAEASERLRRGTLAGAVAYLIWGLFPLYWPLLKPSGALEILAHRVVWSLVVVVALLALTRQWAWIRSMRGARLAWLVLAAVTIAVNWGVYIWGVNAGHVVETSLGYFINPLVTVCIGVVVLGERLRTPQWVAIALATVAVVVLTVQYGHPPWIALVLALSFATYGFAKKKANVDAVASLSVETALLTVLALPYLIWLSATGQSTFGSSGPGHALLLALSGLVTAIPLLAFGYAAVRIPLSTIGLLQYVTPVIQFLIGVLVDHEEMPGARWAGFALVWLALAVFTVDTLRRRTPPASAQLADSELADTEDLSGAALPHGVAERS